LKQLFAGLQSRFSKKVRRTIAISTLVAAGVSENPLVNLAGILFPLIGLIKILRRGIQQSTYQFDLGNFYAR
jgi:hypothetical protein